MAASKHTHARAQCSHASVGLAQARPNYLALSDLHLWRQEYSEAIVNVRNAKQQFLQGKITNDKSCIPDQRLKLLEKLEAYKDIFLYMFYSR